MRPDVLWPCLRMWRSNRNSCGNYRGHRSIAGEDKAYDTADHVANLRGHRCRMWHRTWPSPKPARPAKAPSTNEPRGIRDMACRNHAGRWSSASSDGASNTAPCARPNIVASPASPATSCSIWSPITWSASQTACRLATPRQGAPDIGRENSIQLRRA